MIRRRLPFQPGSASFPAEILGSEPEFLNPEFFTTQEARGCACYGKMDAAVCSSPVPLMPVVLKIDARRKVVYSAFYGKIDDAEVAGHRSAIASDPDFSPDFNEIIDFTAVTDASLSESTLAAMAANPSLFHESVLHIVVAPADLLFQLASKYKGLARFSRPNVMVVRSRDEAYQLLANGVKRE
jgi:hypothetical protein